jgi:membrane protein involved in colicin uptake
MMHKVRRPVPAPSSINSSNAGSPVVGSSGLSSLDRTAVKNAKKAQKRKEEKAASDALQAERLRKHKKQLEKTKINEFYSTGAGKNTPWGTKGSSKRPQATASVNEHGSLIWD